MDSKNNDEELTCFEVETAYKSGKHKTEIVAFKDEETMWEWYDKHHNAAKIEDTYIVDVWPA